MGYSLGKLLPPTDEFANVPDEEYADFWTQEINWSNPFGDPTKGMCVHHGCIEVHAETKEVAIARAEAILFGLGLMQPDLK